MAYVNQNVGGGSVKKKKQTTTPAQAKATAPAASTSTRSSTYTGTRAPQYIPVSDAKAREGYANGLTIARKNSSGGYTYYQRENKPVAAFNFSTRGQNGKPVNYELSRSPFSARWESLNPNEMDNAQYTAYLRAIGASNEMYDAHARSIEDVTSAFYNPYWEGRSTQDYAQSFFKDLFGVDHITFDDDFFEQNQWMRQYAVRNEITGNLTQPSKTKGTTEQWMGYLYESLLADKAQSAEAIEQWGQLRSDLSTRFSDFEAVYKRPPTLDEFLKDFDVSKYSRLYSMDSSRNIGAEKSSKVLQLNLGCNYSRESIAGLYNVLLHGGDISEDRSYFEDAVQYWLDIADEQTAQNSAAASVGYDVSGWEDSDYVAAMNSAYENGDGKTYDTLMRLRYENADKMSSLEGDPNYIAPVFGYYYDDATIDQMRAQYAPIWEQMYTDETRSDVKKPSSKDSMIYHAAYQAWEICERQEATQEVEAEWKALQDEILSIDKSEYLSLDEFKGDILNYIYTTDNDSYDALRNYAKGKVKTARTVFFSDDDLDKYITSVWHSSAPNASAAGSEGAQTASAATPSPVTEATPAPVPALYDYQQAQRAAESATRRFADAQELGKNLIALSASGTVVSQTQLAEMNLPVVPSAILDDPEASTALGALWLAARRNALVEKLGYGASFEDMCAADPVLKMVSNATGYDGETGLTLSGIQKLIVAQSAAQMQNQGLTIADGVIAAAIPSISSLISATGRFCEDVDWNTASVLLNGEFDIAAYNSMYTRSKESGFGSDDAAYNALNGMLYIHTGIRRMTTSFDGNEELASAAKRVEEKVTQSEGYSDAVAVLAPTFSAVASSPEPVDIEDMQDFSGALALGMSEAASPSFSARTKDLLNDIDSGEITSEDIIDGINNSESALRRREESQAQAAQPEQAAAPKAISASRIPDVQGSILNPLTALMNAHARRSQPATLDEALWDTVLAETDLDEAQKSMYRAQFENSKNAKALMDSLPKIAPYMDYDEYKRQVNSAMEAQRQRPGYTPEGEEMLKWVVSELLTRDAYNYAAKYSIGTERYDALDDSMRESADERYNQSIASYTDPTEIRYAIEQRAGTGDGVSKWDKWGDKSWHGVGSKYADDTAIMTGVLTNTLSESDGDLYKMYQDMENYGKWFTYDEINELAGAVLDGKISYDAFADIVSDRVSMYSLATVNAMRNAQELSDSVATLYEALDARTQKPAVFGAQDALTAIRSGADPAILLENNPELAQAIGYDAQKDSFGDDPEKLQSWAERALDYYASNPSPSATTGNSGYYTRAQADVLRKEIDVYKAFGCFGYDYAMSTEDESPPLPSEMKRVGLDKPLSYYLDELTNKQWREPYETDGLGALGTFSTGLSKGLSSFWGVVPGFTRFSRDALSFLPFVTAYQEGDGSYYDRYMSITSKVDDRLANQGTVFDRFMSTVVGETLRNGLVGMVGGAIGTAYNASRLASPSPSNLTWIADANLTGDDGILQLGSAAIRANRMMDKGRLIAQVPFVSSVYINTYNENRNKGKEIAASALRAGVDSSIEWFTESPFIDDQLASMSNRLFPMLHRLSDTSFASIANLVDSAMNEIGQEEISLVLGHVLDTFDETDCGNFFRSFAQSLGTNFANIGPEAAETACSMALISLLGSAFSLGSDTLSHALTTDAIRNRGSVTSDDFQAIVSAALYDLSNGTGSESRVFKAGEGFDVSEYDDFESGNSEDGDAEEVDTERFRRKVAPDGESNVPPWWRGDNASRKSGSESDASQGDIPAWWRRDNTAGNAASESDNSEGNETEGGNRAYTDAFKDLARGRRTFEDLGSLLSSEGNGEEQSGETGASEDASLDDRASQSTDARSYERRPPLTADREFAEEYNRTHPDGRFLYEYNESTGVYERYRNLFHSEGARNDAGIPTLTRKVSDYIDASAKAKADAVANEAGAQLYEKRMAEDSAIRSAQDALDAAVVNSQREEQAMGALAEQENAQKVQLQMVYSAALDEGVDLSAPSVQNSAVAKQQAIAAIRAQQAAQQEKLAAAREAVQRAEAKLAEARAQAEATYQQEVERKRNEAREEAERLLKQYREREDDRGRSKAQKDLQANAERAQMEQGFYTGSEKGDAGKPIYEGSPEDENLKKADKKGSYSGAEYTPEEYENDDSHLIPSEAGEEEGFYSDISGGVVDKQYTKSVHESDGKQEGHDSRNPLQEENTTDEYADATNPAVTSLADSLRKLADAIRRSGSIRDSLDTGDGEQTSSMDDYVALPKSSFSELRSMAKRARIPSDMLGLFFKQQTDSEENLSARSGAPTYRDGELASEQLSRPNRADQTLARASRLFGTDYGRIQQAFADSYRVEPFKESEGEIILKMTPVNADESAELLAARSQYYSFVRDAQKITEHERELKHNLGNPRLAAKQGEYLEALGDLKKQRDELRPGMIEAQREYKRLTDERNASVRPVYMKFKTGELLEALDMNEVEYNGVRRDRRWLLDRYLALNDDHSFSGDAYESLYDSAQKLSNEELARGIAEREGMGVEGKSFAEWVSENNPSDDDLKNMLADMLTTEDLSDENAAIVRQNIGGMSRAELIDEITYTRSELRQSATRGAGLDGIEHTVFNSASQANAYAAESEQDWKSTSTEQSYYVHAGFLALYHQYENMLKRSGNQQPLNPLQSVMRAVFPNGFDGFLTKLNDLSNRAGSSMNREGALGELLDEVAPMLSNGKRYLSADANDGAVLKVYAANADHSGGNWKPNVKNDPLKDANGDPSLTKAQGYLRNALNELSNPDRERQNYTVRVVENVDGQLVSRQVGEMYEGGRYTPTYNHVMQNAKAIFVQHRTGGKQVYIDMDYCIEPSGRASDDAIARNVDEAYRTLTEALHSDDSAPNLAQFKTYARAYLNARAKQLHRENMNIASQWRKSGSTMRDEHLAQLALTLRQNQKEIDAISGTAGDDAALDQYLMQYAFGERGTYPAELQAALAQLHGDVAEASAREALNALCAAAETEEAALRQSEPRPAEPEQAEPALSPGLRQGLSEWAQDKRYSSADAPNATDEYLYYYAKAIQLYMSEGDSERYRFYLEQVQSREGRNIPWSGLDEQLKRSEAGQGIPFPSVRMTNKQRAMIYSAYAGEDAAQTDAQTSRQEVFPRDEIAQHNDEVNTRGMEAAERAQYYADRARETRALNPERSQRYEEKVTEAVREAGMYDAGTGEATAPEASAGAEEEAAVPVAVFSRNRDTSSSKRAANPVEEVAEPEAAPAGSDDTPLETEANRAPESDDLSQKRIEAAPLNAESMDAGAELISQQRAERKRLQNQIDSITKQMNAKRRSGAQAFMDRRSSRQALEEQRKGLRPGSDEYRRVNDQISGLYEEELADVAGRDAYDALMRLQDERRALEAQRNAYRDAINSNTEMLYGSKFAVEYLKNQNRHELGKPITGTKNGLNPRQAALSLAQYIKSHFKKPYGKMTVYTSGQIGEALSDLFDQRFFQEQSQRARGVTRVADELQQRLAGLEYENAVISNRLNPDQTTQDDLAEAKTALIETYRSLVRRKNLSTTKQSESDYKEALAQAERQAAEAVERIDSRYAEGKLSKERLTELANELGNEATGAIARGRDTLSRLRFAARQLRALGNGDFIGILEGRYGGALPAPLLDVYLGFVQMATEGKHGKSRKKLFKIIDSAEMSEEDRAVVREFYEGDHNLDWLSARYDDDPLNMTFLRQLDLIRAVADQNRKTFESGANRFHPLTRMFTMNERWVDEAFGEYAPIINATFIHPQLTADNMASAEANEWQDRFSKIADRTIKVNYGGEARRMNIREVIGHFIDERAWDKEHENDVDYIDSKFAAYGITDAKDQADILDGIAIARSYFEEALYRKNEKLMNNGQQPIPMRGDGWYLPHRQGDDGIWDALGLHVKSDEVPMHTFGETMDYDASREFDASKLERKGTQTDEFDIVKLLNGALRPDMNAIYQLDNVMRHRSLTEAMTGNYAVDENGNPIMENAGKDLAPKIDSYTFEVGPDGKLTKSRGSAILSFFKEQANRAANKRQGFTRKLETQTGRTLYPIMNAVKSLRTLNMIGLNVKSAASNIIATVPAIVDHPISAVSAIYQTLTQWGKKRGDKNADFITNNSSYVAGRSGFAPEERAILPKISEFMMSPAELVDTFATNVLVRTYYTTVARQNRDYSPEQALAQAEDWARRVQATKTRAARGSFYEDELTSFIGQFSQESVNTIYYTFKDAVHYSGSVPKYIVRTLAAFMLYWLYNDKMATSTAIDPIGSVKDAVENNDDFGSMLGSAVKNIWGSMNPFADQLDSGLGGIPSLSTIVDSFSNFSDGDFLEGAETLLASFAPGGTQIDRTYTGLTDMAKGYSETGSGNVKFVTDSDDPLSWVVAGLLGINTTGAAREYMHNGYKSIGSSKSQSFRDLVERGYRPSEAFAVVQGNAEQTIAANQANIAAKMEGATISDRRAAEEANRAVRDSQAIPSGLAPWADEAFQSGDANDPVNIGVRVWRETGRDVLPKEITPKTNEADGTTYISIDGVYRTVTQEQVDQMNAAYRRNYRRTLKNYANGKYGEVGSDNAVEALEKALRKLYTGIPKNTLKGE